MTQRLSKCKNIIPCNLSYHNKMKLETNSKGKTIQTHGIQITSLLLMNHRRKSMENSKNS